MVYNTAPAPVLSIGSLVFRAQKPIHGDIYIIVYGYINEHQYMYIYM
jgi:hypothetical protein